MPNCRAKKQKNSITLIERKLSAYKFIFDHYHWQIAINTVRGPYTNCPNIQLRHIKWHQDVYTYQILLIVHLQYRMCKHWRLCQCIYLKFMLSEMGPKSQGTLRKLLIFNVAIKICYVPCDHVCGKMRNGSNTGNS